MKETLHDDQLPPDERYKNIMRQRTFNPELRNLIDKIEKSEHSPENEEYPPEHDLVRSFHQLYYKIKNSSELEDSSSPDLPALFDYNRHFDSSLLAELVKKEISTLGFATGAVFEFDFEAEGFFISAGDHFSGDACIALSSPLYRRLAATEEGILLPGNEIAADSYLAKVFNRGEESTDLYLVHAPFVTAGVKKKFMYGSDFLTDRLSPVIAVRGETLNVSPEDLLAAIRNGTSVYLLVMQKLLRDRMKKRMGAGLLDPQFLEMVLSIYDTGTDMTVLHVSLSGTRSAEMIYLLIYLAEKIKKRISSNGLVVRFRPDSLLVFTSEEYAALVTEIFIMLDSSIQSGFSIKKHSPAEMLRDDFIRKKYF